MNFKPAQLLVVLLATAVPAMAQNVATVNGKAIPAARLEAFVKQATAQGQQDSPQLREAIKRDLIVQEVVLQEAVKSAATLEKIPEVKSQLELARQQVLMEALMYDYAKKNPVSDAEIQQEYDRMKAQAGDKEYHIAHIQTDKEDEAKAIIAKLKAGAKFEELAKQSKDTGSAANGGDLDWVVPSGLPPAFGQAFTALQKGQFTETPVKSDRGFHIIKVDDTRPIKFPTLEEVKGQLGRGLQQRKVQQYQEGLLKKAKIAG
ncbi:peptidylprolyl isomerase [Undibacterium luofuense]|uniref:peptidylprolyl isomerase n=1 Tax=Undibacterium luofuense TaxID=2828733 RepID=A0A941DQN1_9BURK|nr:peptidylprolyl isomerase [Undibacterium luofuense]MBR7783081.1 peptidylprolyl isomerase [Undibacterium luofuense]